jgi:sterol desaturase/sphingolipid hydroxylase (fatty acid hydroxylase superfamily)
VVTPSLHRLHHSERPELHSANFGTIFSGWDRIWRTFIDGNADTTVALGLPGQQGRALGLEETLRLPFQRSRR